MIARKSLDCTQMFNCSFVGAVHAQLYAVHFFWAQYPYQAGLIR